MEITALNSNNRPGFRIIVQMPLKQTDFNHFGQDRLPQLTFSSLKRDQKTGQVENPKSLIFQDKSLLLMPTSFSPENQGFLTPEIPLKAS